jgi:hypothetical protein
MALYAPLAVLALVPIWLVLLCTGYMFMFYALGMPTLYEAFVESGSSLLTLGFAAPGDSLPRTVLSFVEAATGMVMTALLIGYLPTIYGAFSRREILVTALEIRAGSPPSAVELIKRYHRIQGFSRLAELWDQWEMWFADIEESHTSIAATSLFRSPRPHRSWVTAAGTVMDAAALVLSSSDFPFEAKASLCVRAGFVSLRYITDFYEIPYNPAPRFPKDPISISRAEFDAALDELSAAGIALKPDREQAWANFAGWRVNYDRVLIALCRLTMAPVAPWSSDRPGAQDSFDASLFHRKARRDLLP